MVVVLEESIQPGNQAFPDKLARRESRPIPLPTVAQTATVAALIFGAHTALELSGGPTPGFVDVLNALAFAAVGAVSIPLAARAASSSRGRLRGAWTAMTIALSYWMLAESLWAYYELVEAQTPFPSWADASYLAYLASVVVALVSFPGTRTWRDQSRVVLDSLVVAGSFFVILWLAVMRSLWLSSEGGGLEFAVALAYPVGNVLVMTVGVLIFVRSAPGRRLTMALLVAGLGCGVAAEIVWAYTKNSADHTVGSLPEILCFGGALITMVALVAAQHEKPGGAATPSSPGLLSLWLPLLPLAVASMFVAGADREAVTEAPVVITCVLLVAAALLRQLLEAAELIRRDQQNRLLASRLDAELESAAHYVASILPGDLTGPVTVRSRYLPARAVGGDSFGYTWIDDDHLIVYLIDVSGHGVRPALLSVSVHNLLRSRSLSAETLLEPERVLAALNERFAMDSHDDHYFTMWFGVYRRSTGVLRYANGGHPPPLALTTADGGVCCRPLNGGSMPVGMFGESEFSVHTYPVSAGTRILLYSDGVLGDPPEMDDLLTLCEELATDPEWLDVLVERRFGEHHGDDDCSLVELTFPDPAPLAADAAGVMSARPR